MNTLTGPPLRRAGDAIGLAMSVIAEVGAIDNIGTAGTFEREPWLSPRISRLHDGRLVIVCDKNDFLHILESQPSGITIWWSEDEGSTWSGPHETGVPGIETDKVVELDDGTLILGSHVHSPRTRKLTQCVTRSTDGGWTWNGTVVIAGDDIHHYCEGAIIQLPSGRLVCVMRENNHGNYPCYVAFSDDRGLTWTKPIEAPFSGDRPYAGLLSDGRFLVTFANQAGRPTTYAWPGDIEQEAGYRVAIADRNRGRATALVSAPLRDLEPNIASCALSRNQHLIELTAGELRLRNKFETPIRYHLLPPDSPDADVEFEAELRVDGGGGAHARIVIARVGISLEIAPGWLRLDGPGTRRRVMPRGPGAFHLKPLDMTEWRTLRVEHRGGFTDILVDGVSVVRKPHWGDPQLERSSFGTTGASDGVVALHRVRYATRDEGREHRWEWDAAAGTFPNQYEIDRWIELAENTEAFPDHGYTTWAELPGGEILVASTTSMGMPLQKAALHGYRFALADI